MPQTDTTEDPLVVVVVRSGGIAGLSKQWRAEPEPSRTAQWRTLIESCPWDAPLPAPRGADRYQWRIEVLEGESPVHRARLGDGHLQGPWRVLVDEVRHAAAPSRPR